MLVLSRKKGEGITISHPAGDNSQQSQSGDNSKQDAIGKDCCCAAAGHNCSVRVGERGAFALAYWSDADGWRFITGKVGENGIEANTWYHVVNGVIAEKTE